MEQKITFHIDQEDKKKLFEVAKKQRLSLSSFCRVVILEKADELEGYKSK